ncbi:MAG TPA: FHA domain-containing protein [Syntrophobacteria bacterium]|nr:FHA domain-containing protein [Syntrophobacteria bacterium]
MARIILKFKELLLKDFSLQDGGKTIGRAPGNDIVLENLLVSGHHARIDQAGGDYILTDLRSKNGTYVNGARISSAKLKHGDQILVGKHTLVFELDAAQVSAADRNMVEATMFVPSAGVVAGEPSAQGVPGAGAAPPGPTPAEPIGILSYLSGGKGEYELTKKLAKMGKGEEADIQIGGFLTPKVAATISRRPNGYHVTPMTGRVKVRVNGTQIEGSQRLKDFDTIEIGAVVLQFYFKN